MIKNFCKFHNGKLFVIHLNAFLNSKIFIEFFTRLVPKRASHEI